MGKVDLNGGTGRLARRERFWKRLPWMIVAALILLPLAALYVLAATDPTDNIALSRNEVVQGAAGGRVWKGTMWNHSDSLYEDLDTVILFVDREGKPVGQARGGARRLDPGEVFHLEAPLPLEAARMQVYQLRWRTNGSDRLVALGPYQPWEFGYLQDDRCGPVRLKIGSCTPAREAA
jgi:hypothetical protein